jgi:hypothetical protein
MFINPQRKQLGAEITRILVQLAIYKDIARGAGTGMTPPYLT